MDAKFDDRLTATQPTMSPAAVPALAASRIERLWPHPIMTLSDDSALLLAIADRDRAAFMTLFARFGPRLKTWFIRTGGTAGDAEDLAQETMLAIWRKAASFDPTRAGAATWIFTIARNQRIDAHRRAHRWTLDCDDPSLVPAEPDAPDRAFDKAEYETRVRDALKALPEDQAEVIRLSFFEDRPHVEIERLLGIPLGTVKSRLRLALVRLRRSLAIEPRPSDQNTSGDPS